MAVTASGVHVDELMTGFALGYRKNDFVADEIFPPVSVEKKSNKYPVFGLEHTDVFSDERGKDGSYNRVTAGQSTDSYECVDRGLENPIDYSDINNNDAAFGDLVQNRTATTMERVLLAREVRAAALVTGGGWSTSHALSGTSCWDNQDSDPRQQILDDKDAMLALGAAEPNRLFMSADVWTKLRNHPKLIKMFEVGLLPSIQRIADYFEVERLIIMGGLKNTAKPGQTRSLSRILTRTVFLFHFPTGSEISQATPKAGCQFEWRTDTGGQRLLVERYDEDNRRQHIVRVRLNADMKVTGTSFGALRTTVVAA